MDIAFEKVEGLNAIEAFKVVYKKKLLGHAVTVVESGIKHPLGQMRRFSFIPDPEFGLEPWETAKAFGIFRSARDVEDPLKDMFARLSKHIEASGLY